MAPVTLTKDNFVEAVQGTDVVLVDFWAEWCGPCRQFAPIFDAAAQRHEDVAFGKVDTEDQQELAMGLDIQAIPTLMAFKEGTLVFRQAGVLNGSQLDDLISQVKELDLKAAMAAAEGEGVAEDAE